MARASVRPGSFVATAASRSGTEAGAERSEEGRDWGQWRPQHGGSSGAAWLHCQGRGSEQACVCGRGNDALLSPALGKQGSRVEEGETRERESRERKRFDRVKFEFFSKFLT